jgi:glycerophosphoryl diester phosphodiesterase
MLQLPKVIGHRGAAAYAPENTLASFREARRRGATWVEADIVLTADDVPIVMHDDSLKRTTGVDRLVAETRRADLPTDVPTFEEAIACWGELGLGCNVEIKPTKGREAETARAVVETLRRCWPSHLPQPLLEIHNAGYALGVYTINDGDVAKALVGMGVDCVITDVPDVILAALS